MIYFPLVILNIIVSIICYITNPIVVLFADNVGELHGFLRYWQTWDDSLDVEFMVKEKVPSIFRYDFDSKYISSRESTTELAEVGRDKGCVILKSGAIFSTKEKIQRYFCRLLWLCRNNAYGFSFYIFGRKVKGSDIVMKKNINTYKEKFIFGYDKSKYIWNCPWILIIDKLFLSNIGITIFLGWKLDFYDTSDKKKMAMIANRIVPLIK
jgi:hypothetical protein